MGRLPMSRRQGGGETAREGGGEGVEERWKVQERMHSQGVRESRRGGRVWWKREERWRFIRGELERKKKGGCSAVEGGEGGEGLSRVRRERGKEIDMEEGKKYGSIRKARDTETRRVLYNFSFFVCVVFMPMSVCLPRTTQDSGTEPILAVKKSATSSFTRHYFFFLSFRIYLVENFNVVSRADTDVLGRRGRQNTSSLKTLW